MQGIRRQAATVVVSTLPSASSADAAPTAQAAPGPTARNEHGVLAALQGLVGRHSGPPAEVVPEVVTAQTRGSRRTKISVKTDDAKTAKALQRDVLGKGTGLIATTPPRAQGPGSTLQYGHTQDGTALRIAMGPAGSSAIASHGPVYEPVAKPALTRLEKLAAPLLNLLPAKPAVLERSPSQIDPGLRTVPSHLITGVAGVPNGALFGIGPQGGLYRMEAGQKEWAPVAGARGHEFAQLSPQPDGGLYAVRAARGGGAELLRLDGAEPQRVHVSERPVASYAVAPNGSVMVLDDQSRLTRVNGATAQHGPLKLLAADGSALPEVGASAIGLTAGGQAFVAGHDGQLYRLDGQAGAKGFTARHVDTPFPGRPELARNSTLVDLGNTLDPRTGEAVLHALYRQPTGELFSAYHADEGFKPGWRFDNAYIAQNRRGMEPIRIAPSDAVPINRDGVQLAVKRGRLHVGHEGGSWQPAGVEGLARVKANPAGLEKSYGLQSVTQPDGSRQQRIVRIDLEAEHPTLPAGGAPRVGTVANAVGAKLTELASGAIRDFAVLESLGATPGDDSKRMYYVDHQNRLFTRDLNAAGPAQPLATNDIGTISQIAMDGDGRLHALAARAGQAPQLYQLGAGAGSPHEWLPQNVPLALGHELVGLDNTWAGRLRLNVAAPSETADGPTATYLFSPKTGLAPLDRQSAIDAMKAAGGLEFHLPGLPAVHAHNELLGFKSTSRPFLSNTVNWLESAWAHTRGLKSAPKVALRWAQHKRHGREGLQPLYQSTAAAGAFHQQHLARAGRPEAAAGLGASLRALGSRQPELAGQMQGFAAELMRSNRQMLQHIGHATGFLDANGSADPGFRSKPPKKPGSDLVDDLHRWLNEHAAHNPGASDGDTAKALAMLEQMRNGPNRLYLRSPAAEPDKARAGSEEPVLLNARLVRNIQALQELATLAAGGQGGAELGAKGASLQQRFEALKAGHAQDPLTQYTNLAFQNVGRLEDTYDIFRTFSKTLNNWRHPLNKTMAQSMGVESPSRRKASLLEAARQSQKDGTPLDPNLLQKYGATDAQALERMLADKKHPEHARLSAQLKTESSEAFKQGFVDIVLGLKTKETYSNDRSYAVGIDPLGFINNKLGVFAFAGATLGRNYNVSVEVMGDNPRGGDLSFLIEKARDISGEVAGGWGKSSGHADGFLEHYLRGALIGEIGVHHTAAGGLYFMVPRDKMQDFTDKLFDFGKKSDSGMKDLQQLLAPAYERETYTRTEIDVEAKLQGFLRAGPNGYNEDAGGHFWAARPTLIHGEVGIGHESTTYKMHGQTLDGELQPGAERHDYWSQEAALKLPGLRFRSWFNFPTDADSENQAFVGVGNTDSEPTLGLHNKDGAKTEYRTAVPQPVAPAQWGALLDEARQAFPAQREQLDGMRNWAQAPEAFADRLAGLRTEVQGWQGQAGDTKALLDSIDLMRWQHSLAAAGKPMVFGLIHEVRAANASRLTQPASWTRLAESIFGADGKADDPLRKLYAQLDQDPTLKELIRDLQATHPGRLKIKCEPTPEAMNRLVQMQLDNPNLPESRIADFLRDSGNFRINTIAALKTAEVSNGASVWPVIGVISGTATSVEELKGSVHFEYDAQGRHAGYQLEGDFARKRKSVARPGAAFAAQGNEAAQIPWQYGPAAADAPRQTGTAASAVFDRGNVSARIGSRSGDSFRLGDSARTTFFDASDHPLPDSVHEPIARAGDGSPGGSARSEYVNARTGSPTLGELFEHDKAPMLTLDVAGSEPPARRGLASRAQGVLRKMFRS